MYSRFLQITLLLFCFVKDFLIQSAVLMCNDRCADSVTGDVDCCSCHIQDTVDTHDKPNCLNRKSYRVEYHRQGYKTNTRYTGSTYGSMKFFMFRLARLYA